LRVSISNYLNDGSFLEKDVGKEDKAVVGIQILVIHSAQCLWLGVPGFFG
jgi:hypothetical protein